MAYAFSQCTVCEKWYRKDTGWQFCHEGAYWSLCGEDGTDYWENTDKLEGDYHEH